MANRPWERFLGFKELSDIKKIHIAVTFEIAKRRAGDIIKHGEKERAAID